MFKKLFKHSDILEVDYFEQSALNLFNANLLITSVFVFLGILVLLLVSFQIDIYTILLFVFPIAYLISLINNFRGYYETSFILYHICSYVLLLYLIVLYGKEANFQLYFFSIGFSIYLYTNVRKSYQKYLLGLYVFTFILANLYSYKAVCSKETTLIGFFNFGNLFLSSLVTTIKAVKYVDLKERAVDKYKTSYTNALKAKKELNEKEAIFNFLFNSAIDGAEFSIYSAINNKELVYDANKALTELLKMDKERIKNIDRLSVSPKIQSNGKSSYEYNEELKGLIKKHNQYRYEWDYINGDGEIIHTEITHLRLKEKDKIFNLGFIKNITTNKKTEKELLESELMYRTLFENVYDGIKIDISDKRSGHKINQFVNQKMLALFKVDKYDYEKDDYEKFLPERQCNNKNSLQLVTELKKEFEKNATIDFRLNLIDADKEPFTADFTAIQIETESIRKVVLIAKDVTEIEKKEQIIRNQVLILEKKKAELIKYIESNKQLELFAFRASHDLKGPIATVSQFINILKSRNIDKFDEKSLSYFDFIETSIAYLCDFIDDCLNHSRITSKKINIQNINLKQAIKIVLNNLKSSIEENNAQITLGNMPEFINADEIKLITLLQNLISNAIRYRKRNLQPLINITCTENENYYKFSITDNGIGIKDEHQSKIFDLYESFYQNDGELVNINQRGTGIGLSTCLKLIELHKGDIWVESIYGEGSTFYFIISKNLNQIINN